MAERIVTEIETGSIPDHPDGDKSSLLTLCEAAVLVHDGFNIGLNDEVLEWLKLMHRVNLAFPEELPTATIGTVADLVKERP